jgi:hypothetical protein
MRLQKRGDEPREIPDRDLEDGFLAAYVGRDPLMPLRQALAVFLRRTAGEDGQNAVWWDAEQFEDLYRKVVARLRLIASALPDDVSI